MPREALVENLACQNVYLHPLDYNMTAFLITESFLQVKDKH